MARPRKEMPSRDFQGSSSIIRPNDSAAAILRQLGGRVQVGQVANHRPESVEDNQPGRVRVVGGEDVLRVLDGRGVRGGELDRYQPVVEVAAGGSPCSG